jgi:hypothetical protein
VDIRICSGQPKRVRAHLDDVLHFALFCALEFFQVLKRICEVLPAGPRRMPQGTSRQNHQIIGIFGRTIARKMHYSGTRQRKQLSYTHSSMRITLKNVECLRKHLLS